MTHLEKLIATVEAGSIPEDATCGAFKDIGFKHMSRALAAYNGSLDAALRLHEALLPGWAWTVGDNEATVWPPNEIADEPWCADGVSAPADGRPPARAWLLAILRALKAKGDA